MFELKILGIMFWIHGLFSDLEALPNGQSRRLTYHILFLLITNSIESWKTYSCLNFKTSKIQWQCIEAFGPVYTVSSSLSIKKEPKSTMQRFKFCKCLNWIWRDMFALTLMQNFSQWTGRALVKPTEFPCLPTQQIFRK
jgi:hypothetical protein